MFRNKTFNIINEEDTKKSKEPNKYGWLRYLIVPGLICFALMLIIVNVDFSGNNYVCMEHNNTNNTNNTFTKTLLNNDARSFKTEIFITSNNLCSTIGDDNCKLQCFVTSTDGKDLNKFLENQYKLCNGPMEVQMQSSLFKSSTFGKEDLNGNFRLVNLTFFHCFLDKIADNAFNKTSLNDLENLIILESKLETMNDKTFAGLNKLKYLEILNKPISMKLTANSIFKPVSATLEKLIFLHNSVLQQSFNPGQWLSGDELKKLKHVNMQGNYFKETLNQNSFETLKSVEYLNLHNCYISVLKDDTFDLILPTLRILILSQNQLIHLSPHMLLNMEKAEVELTLTTNYWDCSCANNALIKAVKNENIKFTEIPKCFTPNEFYGENMNTIKICCPAIEDECKEETTTTIGTTISPYDKTTIITTTENIVESFRKIDLRCYNCLNVELFLTITLNGRLVLFKIETISETSVKITVNAIPAEASLLYFITQKKDDAKYEILRTPMIINNLQIDQTYIFCVLPLKNEIMSPFNCIAHSMLRNKTVKENKAWLHHHNMAVFITLATIGVIVFLSFGLLSMFLLLRWRPTLIKNKRLVKLGSDSKQVFLKKDRSTLTTDEAYEALRTYASVHHIVINNNDKYLRNASLPQTAVEMETSLEYSPPKERAPVLPPMIRQLRTWSTQSTIPADDISALQGIPEDFNEHEYQSLDLYQQIYGTNYEYSNA